MMLAKHNGLANLDLEAKKKIVSKKMKRTTSAVQVAQK